MSLTKASPVQMNKPVFYRHETFHPRYGWFKKIYDAVSQDGNIFLHDDANVLLGVGKNMVKSMRYWGWAFKIVEEGPMSASRQRSFTISNFGKLIFDDKEGIDPFLEDPATLWLLHWELLKEPVSATAWWFLFNGFHKTSFVIDDLFLALKKYKDTTYPNYSVNDSSLLKDINCILRMYLGSLRKETVHEDSIDCPFRELRLMFYDDESKTFSFNYGKKAILPSEIIVASILDYIDCHAQNASTISVARLLHDFNSPGLAFKLTETQICLAIEEIAKKFPSISLAESGGILQFIYNGDPIHLKNKIIKRCYAKN